MSPPSDVNAYAMDKSELEIAERAVFRDLMNADQATYAQRQQLVLVYVRLIFERSLRETERRLGLRSQKN